jgi:protein-L-isoaspartate O-methyltransferase
MNKTGQRREEQLRVAVRVVQATGVQGVCSSGPFKAILRAIQVKEGGGSA